METILGNTSAELTYRQDGDGAVILRAVTCDSTLILPETIHGLPVTALGDHALTPGQRTAEGAQLRITCGPDGGEPWDNRHLTAVTLPSALREVGDYAFYNCTELETLFLHEGLRLWGGGALMNCRKLRCFHLTVPEGESRRTLFLLADQLSREVDVTLHYGGGELARLLFPEYQELLEENIPAHHFDFKIFGAGYPYHHCFRDTAFSFPVYDGLWSSYLQTEHDPDCALRLCWWRLRYPRGLGEAHRDAYLAYLRAHAGDAVTWLLTERDFPGLSWLLHTVEPGREALSAGCALARQLHAAEGQALLLEALHRRFSAIGKTFDL